MPVVHKSTIKRARQAEKRNQRNRTVLSSIKSVMRKVVDAVEEKNADEATSSLREATSALHKAVTKGVIKRNTASRRISRLAAKVNEVRAAQT
ncbi:MAG: 30S ribosomal protein S20 [Nitrospiraceae bacterium]|jgi:small subunit ribosomal protein S20|nr:30S ribosomal protein S20 [Nitrospiraceae bacterium]